MKYGTSEYHRSKKTHTPKSTMISQKEEKSAELRLDRPAANLGRWSQAHPSLGVPRRGTHPATDSSFSFGWTKGRKRKSFWQAGHVGSYYSRLPSKSLTFRITHLPCRTYALFLQLRVQYYCVRGRRWWRGCWVVCHLQEESVDPLWCSGCPPPRRKNILIRPIWNSR